MILAFSTQLNGKPTYFVEKILLGIDKHIGIHPTELFLKKYTENFDSKTPVNLNSKIHTIRRDNKNRWKRNKIIHFYINNRSKNAFQFAPIIPVVSVQNIEIKWHNKNRNDLKFWYKDATLCIDDVYLNCQQCIELSKNDGFETIEDFFAYFNEDFTGKIIHWTDKRY